MRLHLFAVVIGCSLMVGCGVLPLPLGGPAVRRPATPTSPATTSTLAPAEVQRQIDRAVQVWPEASPQVLAPPPTVPADPTEQEDMDWLRGWARDTLVHGNVNTATLRGDLRPWADTDDSRLSVEYVRENPGLDSLVMATRFGDGWAVVAPPRVRGEWSVPVTGPTKLQVRWSGTFAYRLERGDDARIQLVQRRMTFDYDTVSGMMGWKARAFVPGMDPCAGHQESAIVPGDPPTSVPAVVEEPTRFSPGAVPDVHDQLREAGCADAQATPWPPVRETDW